MAAPATRLVPGALALLLACGSSDVRQLVDVAVEPPGDRCAAGGTVVRVGGDDDGDGALGTDEVEEETLLCNGDGGPPQLVDVAAEPAGANCSAGGVAVRTGLDDDRDGELDADEVDETRYVCDADPTPDVIYGNLLIDEAGEAAQLAGVRVVTGSVSVAVPGLSALDIASLEEVGADLTVSQASVTDLSAPALRLVGHNLTVQNNEVLSLDLSGLEEVGRTLDISGGGLIDLDLSSLVRVGVPGSSGDLLLSGPLSTVSLDSLDKVERFITIHGRQTTSVSAPLLTHAYALQIVDSTVLETLSFPALVDAELVGVGNTANFSVMTGFPSLTTADELAIRLNDDLVAIDLPALVTVGTLIVQTNPKLPTCAAEALRDQTSPTNVFISGNDDGGTCP